VATLCLCAPNLSQELETIEKLEVKNFLGSSDSARIFFSFGSKKYGSAQTFCRFEASALVANQITITTLFIME